MECKEGRTSAMRVFHVELNGCDVWCRDMEGEAMQSIYAEVQQHLLGKFGNLVAVCLQEHLKVSSVCVATEHVSSHCMQDNCHCAYTLVMNLSCVSQAGQQNPVASIQA